MDQRQSVVVRTTLEGIHGLCQVLLQNHSVVGHSLSLITVFLSLGMASLVAQMVKNLPTMQETWVQFLGWEDPLEKEMATYSSILAWRIL